MIAYESHPDGWVAHGDITIGTDRRVLEVALGPLPSTPDPGGLRSTPVVSAAVGFLPLIEAGARRAGDRPVTVTLPANADRPIGGRLLMTAMDGAELIVVVDGGIEAIEAARALAGRPLPVLDLDNPESLAAWLDLLTVDVNIAVPSRRRDEIRAVLGPLELERLHHPVEVDPRPAFEELGIDPSRTPLSDLAAGATGVLAGRIAAGNRRWRRGSRVRDHTAPPSRSP